MLQSIRDRLTGILAFVILGILVIPFAFVGVNQYFGGGAGNLVARVNDREITYNEFNQSFIDFRRRMQQQLGDAFDADQFDSDIARREHLDRMIDEEVLRQAAAELELAIDDDRLAEQIRNLPVFQVDGQFSPDVYQARLLSLGQTPSQFQQRLREDMTISQLPTAIAGSAFATDREFEEFIALAEQRRSFRYALVPPDLASQPESFPEEELAAWYEKNQERFRLPERVRIEYLELDAEQLVVAQGVPDDLLRQRFEDQKARFVTPEQRRVSHVLIEVSPEADDATVETARQEAADIAERARSGEDFAALAREFSDDIGSAEQGGDLGVLEPGMMVEAFENAAYELSLDNPVSEPVKTGFGWHVILLTEVRESAGQTFEEAQAQLMAEYQEEVAEREYLELADRMVDIIYEDPTTLEAAALDLGLEIQEEGPFDRDGGWGIAAEPAVVQAAFSDLVLLQGSVSDPVDLGPNRMVMLRVSERLPSEIQSLEEVREEVIAGLRAERASEAARERAEELLARVQGGAGLEAVSEEAGLALETVSEASRSSVEPDSEVVSGLFELPEPAGDEPVLRVLPASEGYALVALDSVSAGELGEDQLLARRQTRRLLGNFSANTEGYALVKQLRKGADVTVFEENLSGAN